MKKSRRTYNGVHLNKKSNTQDVVEQSLTVKITKEDNPEYAPYRYTLNAYCLDNPQCFNRRYTTLEKALLHCLNGFNENAAIKDRYHSIGEYLLQK